MYKMIVVDDSEMTRQGIRASVNWEVMDVRIVGEAADGLEAMVLIHDTDPDIIICDIRMPKLDGIALINEVLPSHPSLQVIFFSGYSDKEYLKNAIKLEAVDYLYKPLQLHELIGAVEKAKKKCMNKKVHLPQNEADLALSLLQCSENEIPSDLPLDLHAPLVTVIVQMNTAGEHIADRAYDNQLDDLLLASRHYLAFQTVAARMFDGKFVMSCAGKGYILHANVSQDFLNRKTAEVKLSPFFTTLDSGQADVVVGVSNLCTDFKYLREAYDEARAAVRAAFLLGYGRVIFYRDLSQKPFVPSQDMQRELYDRILANDFTQATNFQKAEDVNGKVIFDHLDDADVSATVNSWIDSIAFGIIGLVHIFNPEMVLIGGGISREDEHFIRPLREKILNGAMEQFAKDLEVEAAALGNNAGLLGACAYFRQNF